MRGEKRILLIRPAPDPIGGKFDFGIFHRNQPRCKAHPEKGVVGVDRSPLPHCYVLTSRAVTGPTIITKPPAIWDGQHEA